MSGAKPRIFPYLTCEPLAALSQHYGKTYTRAPANWDLGEQLVISHAFPFNTSAGRGAKDEVGEQSKFLLKHSVMAKDAQLANENATAPLKGRAVDARNEMAVRPQGMDPRSASIIFRRLARVGIVTVEPAEVVQLYSNSSVRDTHSPDPLLDDTAAKRWKAATAVKIAKALAGKLPLATFPDEARCGYEQVQVANSHISGIWRWHDEAHYRWIVQKFCFDGKYRELDDSILYFGEGSSGAPVLKLLELEPPDPERVSIGRAIEEHVVRIHPFRVSQKLAAIARPLTNIVALFDAQTMQKLDVVPLVEGEKLVEVRLTADELHVVQLNSDGKFFVHRRSDGKRMLIGAHVDDEIVVATAPLTKARRPSTFASPAMSASIATISSRPRCAASA